MATEPSLATAIAAAYGLAQVPRCERVERTASTVVRVATPRGTCWLKLADKTRRPLDELEAEAEVVAGLMARGLAVAAPVRRADGRFAGTLDLPDGACAAVLFHDAPGALVVAATTAQSEALGALLARLHLTPVTPATARPTRIDGDMLATVPLAWIRPWLRQAGHVETPEVLEALAADLIERAWPRDGTASLPSGLCHGDVHLENVRFDGDAPTLFDFEACGVGPCAYDLACYWRKRVALAPPGEVPPIAEWEALLRGYSRVRPLTPAELHAVPALAALRAIWVMALPASPRARWGRDWLAAPDYFTAHLEMIARLASVDARAG